MAKKGDRVLMKRLAGTVTGILLLALAGSGGASAKPPVGSCPVKGGEDPFELYPVSDFPGLEFIDLNQNGFICAFNLPQDPRLFQVIDDIAQVP
jgi:hypothetical protein